MIKRNSGLFVFMLVMVIVVAIVYIARAGTLEFDGVPVDITTSSSEDLVIVPGTGGNVQIGDAAGTNTNATMNDDLQVRGVVEVEGVTYTDGGVVSASDIVPDTDSTSDLGTSTEAWSTLS